MRIAVYCDAKVIVTAPTMLPAYKIDRFLRDKADWIKEKVNFYLRQGNTMRVGGSRSEYKKYREHARAFIIDKINKINQVYNFSFNKISIKHHKTRWGSCSRKRNLNFNYKIIFLPERLAEYIIAHELCHLGELNHSYRFWDLVRKYIPDYQQRRRELRKKIF